MTRQSQIKNEIECFREEIIKIKTVVDNFSKMEHDRNKKIDELKKGWEMEYRTRREIEEELARTEMVKQRIELERDVLMRRCEMLEENEKNKDELLFTEIRRGKEMESKIENIELQLACLESRGQNKEVERTEINVDTRGINKFMTIEHQKINRKKNKYTNPRHKKEVKRKGCSEIECDGRENEVNKEQENENKINEEETRGDEIVIVEDTSSEIEESKEEQRGKEEGTKRVREDVLIIGDSMILHTGKEIKKMGLEFSTKCYPGIRTDHLKKVMERDEMIAEMKDKKVVIVHTGTNSVRGWLKNGRTVIDTWEMLKEIKTKIPEAQIVLTSVIYRKDIGKNEIDLVNKQVEWVTSKFGCSFININAWIWEDCLGRDGLHLNFKGNEVLSKVMVGIVKQIRSKVAVSEN